MENENRSAGNGFRGKLAVLSGMDFANHLVQIIEISQEATEGTQVGESLRLQSHRTLEGGRCGWFTVPVEEDGFWRDSD